MSRAPHDVILERALLGSLAAMLPVPILDDFLLRRSRRALFSTLAKESGLALAKDALDVLVEDPSRSLLRTAGEGLVGRIVRLSAIPLRVATRARAALETFELATLFDHYARTLHEGGELYVPRARALRVAMDEALSGVRVGMAGLRDPRAHALALRARLDERWTE